MSFPPCQETARLLILHLNVREIYLSGFWQGVYRKNVPSVASRKTKIPAIPLSRRRHCYKLLAQNTSQSEYYKGACLEMEESQCRSRPCNLKILYETTANPETGQSSFINTGGYSSLVQLKPAWQRYIASSKANHLTELSGHQSFIGLGCCPPPPPLSI